MNSMYIAIVTKINDLKYKCMNNVANFKSKDKSYNVKYNLVECT